MPTPSLMLPHRCLQVLSVVLLWVGFLPSSQAQMANTYHQISILTEDTSETTRNLLHLAVACDEEIQRLVGRRPALTTFYILPDKERTDLRNGMYFYGLDTQRHPIQVRHDLIRGLLHRLAIDLHPPTSKVKLRAVPDWLVAAVHCRVMQADSPFSTHDIYAGFRLLAEKNQLPEWQRIVDRPPPPNLPVLYQLYTESSLCFLKLLRRQKAQTVRDVLMRISVDHSPSQGLMALFPDQLGREEPSQEWYREEMTKLAYRIDQPGSFELIQQELMKIERVTIMIPGESGGFTVRKVLIEEVPLYLKRYDYSRYNLGTMIKDIFMLMQNCPYVVRQSLIMYVEAIEQLRLGNVSSFTEQIRAARKAFSESYMFGTSARGYLIEQEQAHNSAGVRLFAFLNQQNIDTYRTDFENQVEDYLDAMERQLSMPTHSQTSYVRKKEVE